MTKTKKKTIVSDTFETLSDLGKSTVKSTLREVGEALIPNLKNINAIEDSPTDKEGKTTVDNSSELGNKNGAHTSIDTKKLYEEHDKKKIDAVRQRLFNIVKTDEKQTIEENKRKVAEKERTEEIEKQERENRKKEVEDQQQSGELPKGKQRRSIFSPRRKAQEQHPEIKPSVGKQ